jgi:hypothetical protein
MFASSAGAFKHGNRQMTWVQPWDPAAAALEQVLADRLPMLGADHTDTLSTRHEIAYWRGRGGVSKPTISRRGGS